MKKTKIVATIGPASEEEEILSEIIEAGANVLRFNMKHGEVSWHSNVIQKAQKLAREKDHPLGIMIDLQGPEIRVETKKGKAIQVAKGEEVAFETEFSTNKSVKLSDQETIDLLEKGDSILIDDGFYKFKVTGKEDGKVKAKAERDSVIEHRKGMNIPDKKLNLPSLIEEDLEKLDLAAKQEIDYIALSFVRSKEDISTLREEMAKRKINGQVIAKVENRTALQNIDEIIKEADGIMVARGDLGIETPLEGIAYWQKKIIQKCREEETPVIVATQMLQSMTENPLPTRAEVTDVANAIFNGTDAVMLSNETAMGDYPVESVKAMNRIIRYNEPEGDFSLPERKPKSTADMLIRASVGLLREADNSSIKAVLVFTKDGDTARKIASYRPQVPIFAISDDKEAIEKLTVCYGVQSHYTVFDQKELVDPEKIIDYFKKNSLIEKGEKVLLVKAQRWEIADFSNSLTILEV